MSDWQFTVPFPPSVNSMWRCFRNRAILSKRGREYRKAALEALSLQDLGDSPITGRLSVRMDLYAPTHRKHDADNFTKGVFDALTHAQLWEDDEQVDVMHVYKHGKDINPRVEISINLLGEEQ